MVSRVWRAFGLQPHRSETFKLSREPAFVDKPHDVVGPTATHPTAHWGCERTRSCRSRRSRARSCVAEASGQIERHSHDYKRHGTTDLFAVLDIRAGTVIASCKHRV